MATLYNKTISNSPLVTDEMVVLQPNEGLTYPFNFNNYNQVRIGMVFTMTDSTGLDNPVNGSNTYTVAWSSLKNSLYFGLKCNSDPTVFPGINYDSFIGVVSYNAPTLSPKIATNASDPTNLQFENVGVGTVLANQQNTYQSSGLVGGVIITYNLADPSGDLTFFTGLSFKACYLGITYTINNPGQSGQSIYMAVNQDTNFVTLSGVMLGDQNNITYLSGALANPPGSVIGSGTFPWEISNIPLELPSNLFLYSPFSQLRFRCAAVGVSKIY